MAAGTSLPVHERLATLRRVCPGSVQHAYRAVPSQELTTVRILIQLMCLGLATGPGRSHPRHSPGAEGRLVLARVSPDSRCRDRGPSSARAR